MTTDVVTMDVESSLREAVELLTSRHLSGTPVTAGGRLVGVISASDGGPEWDQLEEHTVGEAMSPSVCRIAPTASVYAAAELMVRAGVHRLVVMDGTTLVGLLSSMDIVRAVALRRFVVAEPASHPAHVLEDARR